MLSCTPARVSTSHSRNLPDPSYPTLGQVGASPSRIAQTPSRNHATCSIKIVDGITLAGQEIPVLSGQAVLEVNFKGDMTGIGPILISVVYQPCDDHSCLPATTKQFELNTP